MASEKNIVIHKAKSFIALLQESGIDVSGAYLFGSSIRGLADKDSDIDLAIISKDFSGLPYYDIQKITRYRREVDLRLEIHPFALNDIQDCEPIFLTKIKKEGIRLH